VDIPKLSCPSVYEARLFVCFVCHIEISQTKVLFAMLFDTAGKPSVSRGASSWFDNVSPHNGEVIED
jgi:hypothetical protein